MTMVERVARVICERVADRSADGPHHDREGRSTGMLNWQAYTESAKHAIEAMREPSAEMCLSAAEGAHLKEYVEFHRKDGAARFDVPPEAVHTEAMGPAAAYAVWRLAIDAALSEGDGTR
ncbi:MAG: hypothetical protein JNL61_11390 [Rhizobiaceae bacterium]|nr:hypothetical protein [Rhizobiaceae bacterium]